MQMAIWSKIWKLAGSIHIKLEMSIIRYVTDLQTVLLSWYQDPKESRTQNYFVI